MEQIKFSCCISNSDPTAALGIEIHWNDQTIYQNSQVVEPVTFEFEIADSEQEAANCFKFILSGKLPQHTKINSQGQIISDAVLFLSDIKFDGIEIDHVVHLNSVYHHNFNGNSDWSDQGFFGILGCNGTVTFKYYTPLYLWLLPII